MLQHPLSPLPLMLVESLPVEHATKAPSYCSLPKTSQKVMRATPSDVKLLIVDEISVVSSINLAFVHMRLRSCLAKCGKVSGFGLRICCLWVISSSSDLSMVAQFVRRSPPNQSCPNLGVQLPLIFGKIVSHMMN